MSVKCPYCNCENVQATNLGKRAVATTVSFAAGFVVSVFNKPLGGPTAKEVYKNICPNKEYICLNDNCRRKFIK